MKISAFILLVFILKCSAYSTGAPDNPELCTILLPSHNVAPQTTTSPFHIIVSSSSIDGGESIDVEIRADPGRTFKGFYMIARTVEGLGTDLGEFVANDNETMNFQFRQCGSGFNNAVTHRNNSLKENISFKWISPTTFDGKIEFM